MNKTVLEKIYQQNSDMVGKLRELLRSQVSPDYGVQQVNYTDGSSEYKCYCGLGTPSDKTLFVVKDDETQDFIRFLEDYDNPKVFKHLWGFYKDRL